MPAPGVRYRDLATDKPALVHVLNASGLAVGRMLAALIVSCQEQGVRVKVPKVVHILNASGLAVGRTLAVLIESCQEQGA